MTKRMYLPIETNPNARLDARANRIRLMLGDVYARVVDRVREGMGVVRWGLLKNGEQAGNQARVVRSCTRDDNGHDFPRRAQRRICRT